MRHLRFIAFILMIGVCIAIQAQSDSLKVSNIEYIDGRPYMFKESNGIIVGTSIIPTKDDYGKYHQLGIYIRNNTEQVFDFIPDSISATLLGKSGEESKMKVYTKEKLEKKIKKAQAWTSVLLGISVGLNAGMAGYTTSYNTYKTGGYYYTIPVTTYNYAAANVANMAAQTQMMMMSQQMKNDLKENTFGYLQRNTIHPDAAISGFMNIKYEKGNTLKVNIPINGETYSFEWDVKKKKKNKQ